MYQLFLFFLLLKHLSVLYTCDDNLVNVLIGELVFRVKWECFEDVTRAQINVKTDSYIRYTFIEKIASNRDYVTDKHASRELYNTTWLKIRALQIKNIVVANIQIATKIPKNQCKKRNLAHQLSSAYLH